RPRRNVDRLDAAEDVIERWQPRGFQQVETLARVVRVVGDDQGSKIVVREVARQDNLPAERIGDARLEELGGVRAVGEVGRLTNRTIAGDELNGAVLALAASRLG